MDIKNLALLPTLLPLAASAIVLIAKAFLNENAQKKAISLAGIIGLLLPWIPMALILPQILAHEVPSFMFGGWRDGTGIY